MEISACTFIVATKNKKRKSWITTGIITSINNRDKMYQQLLKDPNNVTLKEKYKILRNKINTLVKKTKNNYYTQKINSNKNSAKNLWDIVREICSNNKKYHKINKINDNGNCIEDLKLITDIMNEHYTTVGKKMAEKISPNPNYRAAQSNPTVNSIFLNATDYLEISDIIISLKNNKAAGTDGLKAETLKIIIESIAKPLADIINKSMEQGHFPTDFKASIVYPIYKSGDRQQVINYRPISIITNFSKIFEKILKKRLCLYLNKFNLISEKQHGFREGISTQDAILKLTTEMYSALDRSKPSLCVFVDLSKAFDTVSHTMLLDTLENIGIRGTALNLFRSYLLKRHQCVKIDNICSSHREVEYGVPQGTVLGPTLFNIYLNGLFSIQSRGKIITYADDTAIFYTADNWGSLKEMAEKDLSLIKEWFEHRLLTINTAKTFFSAHIHQCKYQTIFPVA